MQFYRGCLFGLTIMLPVWVVVGVILWVAFNGR